MRRLDCAGGSSPEATVAAALDGIDDPVVLLDERPVAVTDLWRKLLGAVTGGCCERLVVIHPSGWPRRRVDLVVHAAAGLAGDVVALARSSLVGSPDDVVVEFGADTIAVSAGSAVTVFGRQDIATVVGFIGTATPTAGVVIDAPLELQGAVRDGNELRARLVDKGFRNRHFDVVALARSLTDRPAMVGDRHHRRRRPLLVASAAVLLLVLVTLSAVTVNGSKKVAEQSDSFESLIEGRVSVSVPAHWGIERITGGPGSRRVQVRSPADVGVALHITQTYAPGTNLADTAAVLARAVAAEPAGTFVEFSGEGEVAGRPAVTYREVRTGRVVHWAVFMDGSTRISIGCQSSPTREADVRAPCEQAVRSAREIQ